MRACVLLVVISYILGIVNGQSRPVRQRRDVAGSLDIVSNNLQPIHADVKPEITVTEKPCSTGFLPSHIEPGTVFQVTPPLVSFQQSLRKSLPVPSKLDLARAVSRLAAVLVLAIAAMVEIYPAFAHLASTFYSVVE